MAEQMKPKSEPRMEYRRDGSIMLVDSAGNCIDTAKLMWKCHRSGQWLRQLAEVARCCAGGNNSELEWQCIRAAVAAEIAATSVQRLMTPNDAPRTGYKVLLKYGGGLWSTSSPESGYVKYAYGQWVMPPAGCGPLTVFSRRDDAERFVAGFADIDNYVIRRCRWLPWTEKLPRHETGAPKALWGSGDNECAVMDDLPYGTRLARAVMIETESMQNCVR